MSRKKLKRGWGINVLRVQRDLAIALNEAMCLDKGLKLCLEACIQVSEMDCCAIYLLNERTNIFEMVEAKISKTECIDELKKIGPEMDLYKLIIKGKTIVLRVEDLKLNIKNIKQLTDIKVMAFVPIRYKNKVIGLVNIATTKKRSIPKHILDVMDTIANQIGICITAIKIYDDLQKSEAKYKEFIDILPDAVFEIDDKGKFIFASRRGFEQTGYTQEDIAKGLNAIELIVPEDRERFKHNVSRILSGERLGYNEYVAVRKNGTRFPVEIRSTPVFQDGKVVGIRGIVIDITDRRRMEDELVKSEKFEALSILSGGIAHDFNNLIAIILGNIEIISTENVSEDAKEAILAIEKAVMRAKNLTEQLMTFTKEGVPLKRVTCLADLIREICVFSLRGSKASCIFNIETNLWYADIDEAKISQVIGNILLNSIQAMPKGGLIEIFANNEIVPESNFLNMKPGKYVKVSIKDNGIGIPKDKLPYIFDPYFTTKEKGHGLGLASAYIIVKKHNGYIFAESEYGAGTTITFYLPATEERIVIKEEQIEQSLLKGKGKILLMDDEDDVRKAISGMLNKLGYKVEEAEEGKEALEKIKKALSIEPFDVAILDLTIPGGYGAIEIIKDLLKYAPDIKPILMTGYTADKIINEYEKYGFKNIVIKPFRIETLSRILRKVIYSE